GARALDGLAPLSRRPAPRDHDSPADQCDGREGEPLDRVAEVRPAIQLRRPEPDGLARVGVARAVLGERLHDEVGDRVRGRRADGVVLGADPPGRGIVVGRLRGDADRLAGTGPAVRLTGCPLREEGTIIPVNRTGPSTRKGRRSTVAASGARTHPRLTSTTSPFSRRSGETTCTPGIP